MLFGSGRWQDSRSGSCCCRAPRPAQGTMAGLVTDATGAVLPGVTVEASSAALIEKVRTAVTNTDGRYTIVELRPGTYAVTFTLAGFTTFKREGIDVPRTWPCQSTR